MQSVCPPNLEQSPRPPHGNVGFSPSLDSAPFFIPSLSQPWGLPRSLPQDLGTDWGPFTLPPAAADGLRGPCRSPSRPPHQAAGAPGVAWVSCSLGSLLGGAAQAQTAARQCSPAGRSLGPGAALLGFASLLCSVCLLASSLASPRCQPLSVK